MIRKQNEMKCEKRENMRGGMGVVTLQPLFTPEEFKAPVRLCTRLTLPPGASIGQHDHVTEDEVYVILRGSGLLDEGEGKKRVVAGDAVLTGRGNCHSIENDGIEELELVAFIATYPS